jgi:DNA-directed RNA polymerase subunit M/transcription elongation factor TFIIS
MTSPGQVPVSYLCPRCRTALTAHAEHAGQRRECPHCGKLVKVPGTPGSASTSAAASPAPTAAQPPAPIQQGIAHIAVLCPLCGTRMYATRQQVGQTMVCPDCLETVAVPETSAATPAASPAKPVRTSRSVPPKKPAPSSPVSDPDADDDLKLSDPVTIPVERYLPKNLSDMLRDSASPSSPRPSTERTTSPSAPPGDLPVVRDDVVRDDVVRDDVVRDDVVRDDVVRDDVVHDDFAVKCPTCDTLVYATDDEIGQQRICPDCLSIVQITRPRPKPRRVNEVVEANYEGQLFTLSEPVSLDIYRRTEAGLEPKTMGEDALRKAQRELDDRKQEEFELPAIPLWDGLFRFLPHASVIMRWLVSAALLGGIAKLATATVTWAAAGGVGWFAALMGTVAIIALTVVSFVFIGSTCLTIIQESANGRDQITEWPEMTPIDRAAESLSVAIAVFYAILPGLILFGVTGAMGMPAGTRWIFLGISLYLFFPVVQLSVLESDSLTSPLSQPILTSLSTDFLLWCTFYLMTFAIALLVALTLAPWRADLSTVVVMLLGAVWAFAIFMYYRLLGRLAWACQVRPLEKEDVEQKSEER